MFSHRTVSSVLLTMFKINEAEKTLPQSRSLSWSSDWDGQSGERVPRHKLPFLHMSDGLVSFFMHKTSHFLITLDWTRSGNDFKAIICLLIKSRFQMIIFMSLFLILFGLLPDVATRTSYRCRGKYDMWSGDFAVNLLNSLKNWRTHMRSDICRCVCAVRHMAQVWPDTAEQKHRKGDRYRELLSWLFNSWIPP